MILNFEKTINIQGLNRILEVGDIFSYEINIGSIRRFMIQDIIRISDINLSTEYKVSHLWDRNRYGGYKSIIVGNEVIHAMNTLSRVSTKSNKLAIIVKIRLGSVNKVFYTMESINKLHNLRYEGKEWNLNI